jgi:hypothetical protein
MAKKRLENGGEYAFCDVYTFQNAKGQIKGRILMQIAFETLRQMA